MPKALVRAERVGDLSQRLPDELPHHFGIGDVVWNLAEAIHVVGEAHEPGGCRVAGKESEGCPYHRRPRDFAEGTDVRKPGRTIACLEQHFPALAAQPSDDLPRFLE